MKTSYPFSGVLVRFNRKGIAQSSALTEPTESINKSNPINYGNELHVNIWDFESEAILDVGLMVHKDEIKDGAEICIDIPWSIKKEKVFDIATKIDGERILEAIFNRDVGYESNSTSRNPKIAFPDEPQKNFLLVRLNSTAFEVEEVLIPGGNKISRIVLKPDLKSIHDELTSLKLDRYYFRLRLLQVPREVFAILFTQKDRNLLSSCIEETVLDFRLNPIRGIPPEVLYPSNSDFVFPNFAQMHLFLIEHRDRQPTFQSKNFKASRSLEDEGVWNEYIRLDGNGSEHHIEQVKNYLGYQWSERPKEGTKGIKELVALGRFSRVASDSWTMFRFIIIALLLGAVSNGLWELWQGIADSKGLVTTESKIFVLLAITLVLGYSLNILFKVVSIGWKRFKRISCKKLCRRK